METGSSFWPFDGVDLSFGFPGNGKGEITEKICSTLLKHTTDTSYGVILETAPRYYDCLPHIRLFKPDRTTKKLANALSLGIGRVTKKSEMPSTHLLRYWAEQSIPTFSIVCGKPNIFDQIVVISGCQIAQNLIKPEENMTF